MRECLPCAPCVRLTGIHDGGMVGLIYQTGPLTHSDIRVNSGLRKYFHRVQEAAIIYAPGPGMPVELIGRQNVAHKLTTLTLRQGRE